MPVYSPLSPSTIDNQRLLESSSPRSCRSGGNTPCAQSERLSSSGCLLAPLLNESEDLSLDEPQWEKPPMFKRTFGPMGAGSQRAAMLTMITTAFGSGVLALPWAFARCGLVLGTGLLLVTGLASYVTLLMLADTGYAIMKWNYSEAVAGILGAGLPTTLLQGTIFINALGCIIGYYVFLGSILPQVASAAGFSDVSRTFILLAITVFPLFPLSALRRISFFRYLSMGALGCMASVAVYVVCATPSTVASRGDVDWNNALWGTLFEGTLREGIETFLSSFAIFIFSYQAHMNMFAAVFDMRNPTPGRIDKMLFRSVVLESVVYWAVGAFGALSFGVATPACITDLYPLDDMLANVVRVMVAFSLLVALPLNLFGARGIAYDYAYAGGDDYKPGGEPFLQHVLITGILLGGCVLVAVVEQNIVDVLGVLGGGCELTFMLVYPMLMIRSLQASGALEGKRAIIRWTPHKTTLLMMPLGVLVFLGYTSAGSALLSLLKVPGFGQAGQ